MPGRFHPKQINAYQRARRAITGFAATAATSDIVTTALTTAAATAGNAVNGEASVPVQVASTTQAGFVTTAPDNHAEIWSSTTKAKLSDASGNEVYGRITEAAGVYTLSYFTSVAGVETAYTMTAGNIDFTFTYRYTLNQLPENAHIAIPAAYVGDDPVVSGLTKLRQQLLTPTAQNTLPALTTALGGTNIVAYLVVNGQVMANGDGPSFTAGSTAVTWTPASAGFNVETTDRVWAFYTIA